MNGTQPSVSSKKFHGSSSNLSSGRASPYYDEEIRPLFREWAPLTSLLEKIPPRYHQVNNSLQIILNNYFTLLIISLYIIPGLCIQRIGLDMCRCQLRFNYPRK